MRLKGFFVCLLCAGMFFKSDNSFAAYSIDNFESFEKVPLEYAQILPSNAELMGRRERVVVLRFEDHLLRGAGTTLSERIRKEVSDTGATLIDQTLPPRLMRELEITDRRGPSGYNGQDFADYVITGKITQANISRRYDKHYDKNYTTATVSLAIKITKIPSMQIVKDITEDGQEVTEGFASPEKLYSAAFEKVMVKAHTHVKNQFAPTGYVLEHRTYDHVHIFKVSMGKLSGAEPGQKVLFIKSVPDKNPLTGVTSVDQVKIAEGEITETLTGSYSFVVIKDKDGIDKIRLGDQVKVLYKNSIWDHLKML
jgi:hypothetical protein